MWQRSKPFWMVLPALAIILILFVGGLFEGLIQSLGIIPAGGQSQFSINAYEEIVHSSDFWLSLGLTFRVAGLSTAIAAILGLMMSVCLFILSKSDSAGWVPFWRRWFQLPFVVPHLAGAYLMVLLFTQSGFVSRIFYHLGWTRDMTDFPVLVNEPFGWGMLMAYAWKEAPFISLLVYPVLLRINDTWREAARVFGAGAMSYMKEIVLPLLMPAWLAASFIVFAFTFSAFEVPYLLGVTYPKMLPVLAYEWYTGDLSERPQAMAVGVLLVIITSVLGAVAYRLSSRWMKVTGRGWL